MSKSKKPLDLRMVMQDMSAQERRHEQETASLRAENAAQAEQIEWLREVLAQIQHNASANRVWGGEKWTYLGLTYVAQAKIVRLADAALKEASHD